MSRLYLRAAAATTAPTAGEKSAALPTGTVTNNQTIVERTLSTTKGTAQTSITFSTANPATLSTQSGVLGRWSSPTLAAQTISAQTWSIFQRTYESNGQANILSAGSLYVWRPSTSSVVGYIWDSTTTFNIAYRTTAPTDEWESTSPGSAGVGTFSGSAVTTQAGDILVYEAWYVATQGKASTYTGNLFYFDGTDETTGTGNTSAAAYLDSAVDLDFGSGGATSISAWGVVSI